MFGPMCHCANGVSASTQTYRSSNVLNPATSYSKAQKEKKNAGGHRSGENPFSLSLFFNMMI